MYLSLLSLISLAFDKGALSVLSLRDNILCAAGAKALGEGLKGNQVITELDLAGNEMGKESGAKKEGDAAWREREQIDRHERE